MNHISEHLAKCPHCEKPSVHLGIQDWEDGYSEHVIACPHCMFMDYAVHSSGTLEYAEFEKRTSQWVSICRYFNAPNLSALREMTLTNEMRGETLANYPEGLDLTKYVGFKGDLLFNRNPENKEYYKMQYLTTKEINRTKKRLRKLQEKMAKAKESCDCCDPNEVIGFCDNIPF